MERGSVGGGGGGVSRFVGEEGRLSEVDASRYRARVTFERRSERRGSGGGEKVKEEEETEWFEYEDICKVVPV